MFAHNEWRIYGTLLEMEDEYPDYIDPRDPETKTWWIWIVIGFVTFVIIAFLTFERDFLFE